MAEVQPGFYETENGTLCYIDGNGAEYHPDPLLDPADADAYGLRYVRCDEGIYYYQAETVQVVETDYYLGENDLHVAAETEAVSAAAWGGKYDGAFQSEFKDSYHYKESTASLSSHNSCIAGGQDLPNLEPTPDSQSRTSSSSAAAGGTQTTKGSSTSKILTASRHELDGAGSKHSSLSGSKSRRKHRSKDNSLQWSQRNPNSRSTVESPPLSPSSDAVDMPCLARATSAPYQPHSPSSSAVDMPKLERATSAPYQKHSSSFSVEDSYETKRTSHSRRSNSKRSLTAGQIELCQASSAHLPSGTKTKRKHRKGRPSPDRSQSVSNLGSTHTAESPPPYSRSSSGSQIMKAEPVDLGGTGSLHFPTSGSTARRKHRRDNSLQWSQHTSNSRSTAESPPLSPSSGAVDMPCLARATSAPYQPHSLSSSAADMPKLERATSAPYQKHSLSFSVEDSYETKRTIHSRCSNSNRSLTAGQIELCEASSTHLPSGTKTKRKHRKGRPSPDRSQSVSNLGSTHTAESPGYFRSSSSSQIMKEVPSYLLEEEFEQAMKRESIRRKKEDGINSTTSKCRGSPRFPSSRKWIGEGEHEAAPQEKNKGGSRSSEACARGKSTRGSKSPARQVEGGAAEKNKRGSRTSGRNLPVAEEDRPQEKSARSRPTLFGEPSVKSASRRNLLSGEKDGRSRRCTRYGGRGASLSPVFSESHRRLTLEEENMRPEEPATRPGRRTGLVRSRADRASKRDLMHQQYSAAIAYHNKAESPVETEVEDLEDRIRQREQNHTQQEAEKTSRVSFATHSINGLASAAFSAAKLGKTVAKTTTQAAAGATILAAKSAANATVGVGKFAVNGTVGVANTAVNATAVGAGALTKGASAAVGTLSRAGSVPLLRRTMAPPNAITRLSRGTSLRSFVTLDDTH